MGKSSKAKIVKRLKAAKAKLLKDKISEHNKELNHALILGSKGFQYREKPKLNAFLHPDNPESEFP